MFYFYGVELSASQAHLAVVAFVRVDILRREAFVCAIGTHEMSIRIAPVVTNSLVLPRRRWKFLQASRATMRVHLARMVGVLLGAYATYFDALSCCRLLVVRTEHSLRRWLCDLHASGLLTLNASGPGALR